MDDVGMNLVRNIVHLARIFTAFKKRSVQLSVYPIRLWIESTNACNLKCVMCPNRCGSDDGKGLMSLELYKKIIDEAKGFAHDIYLHHRGEPFLNPNLFEMIRYAKAAGLRTRFHSNGTLLTDEKIISLLEAAPDMVSFSVDGFSAEAYESVRVGAKFEKTMANLFRLLELRRRKGLTKPYIVVERIRFKKPLPGESPECIRDLTRKFMQAGLDEVIVKEEYVWAESGNEEPPLHSIKSCCTFPWYAMVVCWDGTVAPCPQDFQAFMNMGNVSEHSLKEIWNGPAYLALRKDLATRVEALTLCRKCDRLQRKTVGGVPWQYMATFLVDHLIGYNALRKRIGTFERN